MTRRLVRSLRSLAEDLGDLLEDLREHRWDDKSPAQDMLLAQIVEDLEHAGRRLELVEVLEHPRPGLRKCGLRPSPAARRGP